MKLILLLLVLIGVLMFVAELLKPADPKKAIDKIDEEIDALWARYLGS